MAAITLGPAVLSLADDPSQMVVFYTSARSRQVQVPGQVRRMANGRLRTVRRAGSSLSVGVTAVSVSSDVQRTLEEWAGRTVLLRDSWGQKLYGAYYAAVVTDFRERQRRDVALAFSEVTASDFVQ